MTTDSVTSLHPMYAISNAACANLVTQHALKVDVTSLVSKADRRPVVVVVASSATRSRDVVKMVLQKLGMDQQQLSLMQLVAVINSRPHSDDRKFNKLT